jgi:hypothetical protein
VVLCLGVTGAGKGKGSKPTGKPSTELVWAINAIDNTGRHALVVRAGGKVYKVKKDGGCASIRAYDSQKLPLVYFGAFLGPGSYFDVVQENEKCMVDEAVEVKKADLHAVSTEFEGRKEALVKKIQETLLALGKFSGEPEGKLDTATAAAFKAFQKANGIKPNGEPSGEMLLALIAAAQKRNDLETMTMAAKILWPYAAAI